MGYCVQSDIEAEFPHITFGANTKVTQAQLLIWIEQETIYISSRIGTRYQVPVVKGDSPLGFAVVERICIFRVSDRVKNVIEVKSNETQIASDQKQQGNRSRTPNSDLKMIQENKMVLFDVDLISSEDGMTSPCVDVDLNEPCLFFDERLQQW